MEVETNENENPNKFSSTSTEKGFIVTIDRFFCKGCNICVENCPANVLELVDAPNKWQGAYAVVKDIEACTGCALCEVHCPDFAIEVYNPKKAKREAEVGAK